MTWLNEDDVCLPDNLPFHFPLETPTKTEYVVEQLVPLHGDIDRRYHQLINWCMIERYWKFCINKPQCTEAEYNRIVREIEEIEATCEDQITVGYRAPHIPLGCSPTKSVFHYLSCRYPEYIQHLFQNLPHDMQTPWKRLAIQKATPKFKPKIKVRVAEC